MPNFHVLLIHFPIALLSLYAVLEILKIQRLERINGWQTLKDVLLILGSLSTIVAVLSGSVISESFEAAGLERQVEAHEFFAVLTTLSFLGLATSRVFVLWSRSHALAFRGGFMKAVLQFSIMVSNSVITRFLALIALGFLLFTAALGGIIAFGPDIDPFTKILNQIFFGS